MHGKGIWNYSDAFFVFKNNISFGWLLIEIPEK